MVDFFELQRGFDITAKHSEPGSVPVVSSSGVSYYHNLARVCGPGVVTGRKGSIGQVFLIREDFWPHDTTFWVKDFKGNDPAYVKYFLEHTKLERFDEASSVPTLNRNNIHGIKCLFPPISEQGRILTVLHSWEEAIRLIQQLIFEKQELRRGLTQLLFTGRLRFPHFTAVDGYRNTRFGKIPVDWKYIQMGRIACHVSQKNREGRDLPVLSCTKHQGLVDSLTYFGRQVFSNNLGTYKVVMRGQFAYATNHIEEGSIGYQDVYDKALISPMYTVFETREEVNDRFLFLLLKTELYRHIFESMTSSSVNRRGSLRWKDFSKIHVPLPSIEEQAAIVEVFSVLDRERSLLESERDAYLTQRKGLMQQLLTGKTRVRISEPETE